MAKAKPSPKATAQDDPTALLQGHSPELLKALHILTRDGQLNQDSRRKLKQVRHLIQLLAPSIEALLEANHVQTDPFVLVDHGAGKSYLGFMVYDLLLRHRPENASIWGVELREALVHNAVALAQRLGFDHAMKFAALSVEEALHSPLLPAHVGMVTALHACNTATDDAIDFALHKNAQVIALVPCCQAELARHLRAHKNLGQSSLMELWRHPIHTREFGSHLTNVLRCLRLEAHGYQVTTTELVGWEHSLKNELILARKVQKHNPKAERALQSLLAELGLEHDDTLQQRFGIRAGTA